MSEELLSLGGSLGLVEGAFGLCGQLEGQEPDRSCGFSKERSASRVL